MGKARTSASGLIKRDTNPAPALRSETAEKILDVAERLIQTRGCSAFSYQDIADALKIKKASIHYHFESKTDLVIAVIDAGPSVKDVSSARLSEWRRRLR